MARRAALVLSMIIIVAVAMPAALPRQSDSFPLSHYPMYAGDRPAVVAFSTAVLWVGDERQRLSMEVIGNTDDPLIAAALVRDAVAGGQAATLCAEIAARSTEPGVVEIVTERHDLIAFSQDAHAEPLGIDVRASCATP